MLPASIPPKPTHVGGPVLGFAGNELSVRRAQVGDVEQVQAGPPRPLMRRIDKAPARQSLRGRTSCHQNGSTEGGWLGL